MLAIRTLFASDAAELSIQDAISSSTLSAMLGTLNQAKQVEKFTTCNPPQLALY